MSHAAETSIDCIALAARLVAAIAAEDTPGFIHAMREVSALSSPLGVIAALAMRTSSMAKEFYDTDVQTFLDTYAFQAMGMAAKEARDG